MTDLINDEEAAPPAFRRRTVLKGAAAGSVLWAVPSVTSLATRASAASTNPACSPAGHDGFRSCTPSDGNDQAQCGNEGALSYCFCGQDTSGNESCYANVFCDDPQATPCNSNADCANGLTCNSNGCGQICVPCCGAPVAPSARPRGGSSRSAKTAISR
jgi:hypothetical protein